ncbi:MAG: calmodulin-binding protein [Blastopirellula sp.]|nr:MAG: calmodulin-binding protein [Blastopirellula sp.]
MLKHIVFGLVCATILLTASVDAQAGERAYGRTWGGTYGNHDWERFYHYPYVYYPQNFRGAEYYRSSDSLYHRYPQEMRIPVYNKQWQNYYPNGRLYHSGHHFILDVF